jgi:hypothetical protein
MQKLKQGMAAVVLIMSLGLIMPSSFGGSASADPKPGSGTTEEPRLFYCDLDGDGDYSNATPFEVVSQSFGYATFHDLPSTTVLTALYDQRVEVNDPFPPAPPVSEPDGREGEVVITYPIRYYNQGKGLKGGPNAQVVPCHEGPPDEYTYIEDITACCDPLVPGQEYRVFGDRTWYVMLSGNGKGTVQAASTDDGGTQSADHPQKSKHKHKKGGSKRHKGKRGR